MRNVIIFIISLVLFVSCQSVDTEKTVTIEGKYSVSLPSFLTKVNNLVDGASLQYQHALKEFYVIIIDETKEEVYNAISENGLTNRYTNDLNGYASLILDNIELSANVYDKSEILDTTINDMPAKVINLNAKISGVDIYYSIALIESSKRYYQVMTWTLTKYEYQYGDKMKNILYSLKEL